MINKPQKPIKKNNHNITPYFYALPQATRTIFLNKQEQCSNLSLWLDKYVKYENNWQFKEEQKVKFLNNITKSYSFDENLIKANYQRWKALIKSFPYYQNITGYPEWRMVVGLGQTSILETSMTLTRVNGIPIIPGSALKGLTSTYVMLYKLNTTCQTEAEQNYEFKAIFGTQEQQGKVIFLDAVPSKNPQLKVDIMNNHYPDYYEGNKAPSPNQNPIPVYFLTLDSSSQFDFAIVANDAKSDTQNDTEKLVNLATEWLKTALTEMGIGAKTAAGYGYFQIT